MMSIQNKRIVLFLALLAITQIGFSYEMWFSIPELTYISDCIAIGKIHEVENFLVMDVEQQIKGNTKPEVKIYYKISGESFKPKISKDEKYLVFLQKDDKKLFLVGEGDNAIWGRNIIEEQYRPCHPKILTESDINEKKNIVVKILDFYNSQPGNKRLQRCEKMLDSNIKQLQYIGLQLLLDGQIWKDKPLRLGLNSKHNPLLIPYNRKEDILLELSKKFLHLVDSKDLSIRYYALELTRYVPKSAALPKLIDYIDSEKIGIRSRVFSILDNILEIVDKKRKMCIDPYDSSNDFKKLKNDLEIWWGKNKVFIK